MAAYLGNYLSAPQKQKEIEFDFNKILSPIKKEADPNLIAQFCHKLNNDFDDSCQLAIDLIVNKLQSNQEWEILIALQVLEACVKNCGDSFHELISRFRFLNEIIKLISPKYYGNRTSDKCKKKCIELIYCWSRDLPKRVKIKEAYDMLKKQGLVDQDPVYVDKLIINVTPRERNTNTVFEDEEKSRQLARLLKSKNPQDLELANRLIKNMVKQDEIKTEKVSTRINELEQINNNIKLLTEMLNEYVKHKGSSLSEKETIKYLHDELEKMQPKLVQLATDTDDNDDSIGDILKTNDLCENILKRYRQLVDDGNSFNTNLPVDDALVCLSINDNIIPSKSNSNNESSNALNELQDLFSTSDLTTPIVDNKANDMNSFYQDLLSNDYQKPILSPLLPEVIKQKLPEIKNLPSQTNDNKGKNHHFKALDDLNELGRSLLESSLNANGMQPNPMNQLKTKKLNELINEPVQLISTNNNNINILEDNAFCNSFNSLYIELETIRPAISIPALNLYDKNNVKTVLHFSRDSHLNCVFVIVISTTSTHLNESLKNFLFQAAVTKSMKVRLQPSSRSDLPVYNPILPVSAITQVMLIANPNKELVKLKYKINYSVGEKNYSENEQVITLPSLNELS